jgi:hypothetical protein
LIKTLRPEIAGSNATINATKQFDFRNGSEAAMQIIPADRSSWRVSGSLSSTEQECAARLLSESVLHVPAFGCGLFCGARSAGSEALARRIVPSGFSVRLRVDRHPGFDPAQGSRTIAMLVWVPSTEALTPERATQK